MHNLASEPQSLFKSFVSQTHFMTSSKELMVKDIVKISLPFPFFLLKRKCSLLYCWKWGLWAGAVAATKPDYLTLIPRTYTVGGENWSPHVLGLVSVYTHGHIPTHNQQNWKQINEKETRILGPCGHHLDSNYTTNEQCSPVRVAIKNWIVKLTELYKNNSTDLKFITCKRS